jgi:hypothetical protein
MILESQIAKKPYDPAICAWDGIMNYAGLDSYTTILATELVRPGVGPGVFLSLCS